MSGSKLDGSHAANASGALTALVPHLLRGDLTCELSDAALAHALHVTWLFRAGADSFAGPARTVDARGGDVAAVREAASQVREGEVLVIAADGVAGAVLGDRIGALIHGNRAAGVVVAGNLRDVPKLRQLGLAVVASGVVPSRAARTSAGQLDGRIAVGGATLTPGDLVVADPNGVVVVPALKFGPLGTFLRKLNTEG